VPELGSVTPCGEVRLPLYISYEIEEEHNVCNNQCPISMAEAYTLEQGTTQQSKCALWYDARKHRITASTFHRVTQRIKAVDKKFLDSLFTQSTVDTAAMKHGRNTEEAAKEAYLRDFPDRHLHDCGLVVNPKCSFLGASPDAKVCDNGTTGILEVKCPHLKDVKFKDIAESTNSFCLSLHDGALSLKKSHQYYSQIQGQLLVTGAPFCDFYVFSHYDRHYQRIYPDSAKCQEMLQKLCCFYKTHAMPYLSDVNAQ
jgi:hypothetical protein